MSLILKTPDVSMFGDTVAGGAVALPFAFTIPNITASADPPIAAINFNGSTSFIQYANNFVSGFSSQFAMSFWVKPTYQSSVFFPIFIGSKVVFDVFSIFFFPLIPRVPKDATFFLFFFKI